MSRPRRQALRLGAACLAAVALSVLHPATPRGASPNIVISQVYGGGGNSGATLRNDFIELFNRGAVAVDVTGWSVQYASSSGTSWQVTTLAGTIQPGGYYLVQQAAGTGGSTNLPPPDATGSIPMSASAGKVALVSSSGTLSGSCPTGVIDFLGFGSANCSETAPTATLSNTTAASRNSNGCTDTDSNVADFTLSAPSPRNSASPVNVCSGPPPLPSLSIADVSMVEGDSGTTTAAFVVKLNTAAPVGGVTFDIATQDDTATAASGDYDARSVTGATIPAGATEFAFDVTINGDTLVESIETFFVNVTNVTGAAVTDGQAIGTITNDDAAPVVYEVVISQVYGGGGNSGATYTHDFVELFNKGSVPVSLAGWSLQYTSAAGTGTWSASALSGTIQPYGYHLVQLAAGSGGTTPLPTPDGTGTLSLGSGSGKVALLASTTAASGACPASGVVDLVGYGSATCYEGAAPASALSNTLAAFRKRGGCFDSNDNATDFQAASPAPRNSTTPARSCSFLTQAIHAVQGAGAASPYAGQDVTTTGIVTALKNNGAFIQSPDSAVDADPATSEGLFVFTGTAPTVAVGDLVSVRGTAGELFNLTQVESSLPGDVVVVSPGEPLPAAVTLTPAILDPAGTRDQLERFEGMLVRADALTSVAPTNGFGEIHSVLNGVPRPLREPGIEAGLPVPPDPTSGVPDCCIDVWDLNPERIMIDTDGLLGSTPTWVTSNVTLTGVTGPLDFSFGEYKILPTAPLSTSANMSAVAVPAPAANEFTIAGYNIENFSGGDATQLGKAALTVRAVLHYPDIIGLVEIASLSALQKLADRINADAVAALDPDPQYEARLIPFGTGSQHVGFLVKTSRVLIHGVTQERTSDTYIDPTTGTPATLHDRPPLVLDATVDRFGANPGRVLVVVNHLRSFIDVEVVGAAGARVRAKRKAQAEAVAELLQQLQTDNPGVPVIAVGDYNAYQFSDGYTDPIATLLGTPTADDRIVVDQSPDVVNPDFVNLTSSHLSASEQYSFVFEGTPQALDHVLINDVAQAYFQRYAVARVNADFPDDGRAGLKGDATRPEAHSDHDVPVAYFAFPGTPVITLNGEAAMQVEAFTSFTDPGATAQDDFGALSVSVSGTVDANAPGVYVLQYTASNPYATTTISRTVTVADTIAPSISGFRVSPTALGPPNHEMFDVTAFYTATDASGTAGCALTVTSSEATNATGDGNSAVDWIVVNARQVQLRAERSGRGAGRVYTVTATCQDGSGNASSQSATVTVGR